MRTPSWRFVRLGAVGASAVMVLAACGGGNISNNTGAGGSTCSDTLDMAVNPWVGYEADAYVVGEVATKQLGLRGQLQAAQGAAVVGRLR